MCFGSGNPPIQRGQFPIRARGASGGGGGMAAGGAGGGGTSTRQRTGAHQEQMATNRHFQQSGRYEPQRFGNPDKPQGARDTANKVRYYNQTGYSGPPASSRAKASAYTHKQSLLSGGGGSLLS